MKTPAFIVLADDLWKEAYPGPLHVLAGEVATSHPVIWVEAPLHRCWKAPGFGPRLRRSLRLDLPRERYLDDRRELDVLTPPLVPPGNLVGDALLNQTVRWVLKGKKLQPRVLWLARRGAAALAVARGLGADVVVDFHPHPEPGDAWHPSADLVLWPADEPPPQGERADDPRLMRFETGVQGALKLWPMVEAWLTGPIRLRADAEAVGEYRTS